MVVVVNKVTVLMGNIFTRTRSFLCYKYHISIHTYKSFHSVFLEVLKLSLHNFQKNGINLYKMFDMLLLHYCCTILIA